MIRKTITIDEDDYYRICRQLEIIQTDASRVYDCLDNKEEYKRLLKRIFNTSRQLMKDLGWIE